MVASKCRCQFPDCPDGSELGTCHIVLGGKCFTYVEEINNGNGTYSLEKRFGCFGPDEDSLFQCKGYLPNHQVFKNISCCSQSDYCNEKLMTDIIDGQIVFEEKISPFEHVEMWLYAFVATFIMLVLIIAFTFVVFKKKYRKFKQKGFDESIDESEANSHKSLIPTIPVPSVTMIEPSTFGNWTEEDSSTGARQIIPKPYYPRISPIGNCSASEFSGSSNCTNYGHSYRNLSSIASSSLMSENTIQTTLSCQKSTAPLISLVGHSSGSGSGVPRLMQKTVAREIELKELIGTGRFANVFLGLRNDCEYCAVKKFWSHNQSLWSRENEIHSKFIVRHENIITYFGSDIVSTNGCTELWLITEYYPLGSLHDYLKTNPITSLAQMVDLMKAIICGLEYLHSSIPGRGGIGKPMIAHRDLKSKNILMKSPQNCCIADFALVVTKEQDETQIDTGPNLEQCRTVRYLAPEVLTNELNPTMFEEFLRADIYSLGLIFWEIYNRLQIERKGRANEYQVPYGYYCGHDPSISEMIQIVCIEKRRPWVESYQGNKVLTCIGQMIQECWSHNPKARLSSLRVKKRIIDIRTDLNIRYSS